MATQATSLHPEVATDLLSACIAMMGGRSPDDDVPYWEATLMHKVYVTDQPLTSLPPSRLFTALRHNRVEESRLY